MARCNAITMLLVCGIVGWMTVQPLIGVILSLIYISSMYVYVLRPIKPIRIIVALCGIFFLFCLIGIPLSLINY